MTHIEKVFWDSLFMFLHVFLPVMYMQVLKASSAICLKRIQVYKSLAN